MCYALCCLCVTSCAGGRHNTPASCKLTFDLLTLKVVSESRVTWATSVTILVFLGLSVLDLVPIYASDRRQTDVRRASSLNASAIRGRGHNKLNEVLKLSCMHNGKLVGPTHCDATTADSMRYWYMLARLTEMESNTIGLITYRSPSPLSL